MEDDNYVDRPTRRATIDDDNRGVILKKGTLTVRDLDGLIDLMTRENIQRLLDIDHLVQ